MTQQFDVVVVGGGAIGASTAFHLAKQDVSVALLERDRIGGGSTGRAAGGIRKQFSSELITRLMAESTALFETFERQTNRFSFHQIGYLFLGRTEAQGTTLEANVEMQQQCGIDARLLDPDAVDDLVSHLRTDDLVNAAYCPTDGFSDPYAVTTWLVDTARENGATIHENTTVNAVLTDGEQVTGVETSRGRISCDVVVNAAGVWAADVQDQSVPQLPVEPRRIQIAVADVPNVVSKTDPMIVDLDARTYFRPEGEQSLLIGGHNPADDHAANVDSYSETHDFAFVEHITDILVHRVPSFSNARITNGWAGLKGTTPDGDPVVGQFDSLDGYYVATGFNGHGFMLAPVLGRFIAGHMTTGDWPGIDLDPLSPTRFADDTPVTQGEFML